jgi:two-component system chemotaxis response regulator CheY
MGKVLIIDDAEFSRTRIANTLANAGFDVLKARNGPEGLEKFQEKKPDIVLLDINMDGLVALTKLLAIDQNARVIMLSRMGQEISLIEALDAGALDFIFKPASNEQILEVVTSMIAKERV